MIRQIPLLLLALLVFASCESDQTEPIPDVSHINPDYQVHRLEQLVNQKSIDELTAEHPAFADVFFKHVLPVIRQKDYQSALDTILDNPQFQLLVDTTLQVHSDFENTLKELDSGFKFLQYYLPEVDVPDIYTFVSGFEYQRFLSADSSQNNLIGIGLDMFLGSSFPYGSVAPDNPAFSNYLTRRFNKEHLPKKVIELLIDDHLPTAEKNQMLDQMVRNGKKLYLLDKILPMTSDTVIMEYSAEQWDWVQANELELWAFLLKENLFYETSSNKTKKYLSPSPNSPGMPPAAPGRTGNYMGWQIVKSYMKRNPEASIADLVNLTDAQLLLQKSRYKPRK